MLGQNATTGPAVTLLSAVHHLANARAAHGALKRRIEQLQADFEAQHADVFRGLIESKEAMETADRTARALAISEFEITGNKHVAPGVEIRVTKRCEYDPTAALTWAKTAGMQALVLPEQVDKRAFESVAKKVPLPFVTYIEEAGVSIATDLTKALTESVEEAA